jgi:hypothetical protein
MLNKYIIKCLNNNKTKIIYNKIFKTNQINKQTKIIIKKNNKI